MKTCTKCKIEKPKSDFSKMSVAKDGLQPKCKLCDRAHYIKNAERVKKRSSEYRSANASQISEYKKAYRAANAERLSEKDREYNRANAERISRQKKAYRAANAEKTAWDKRSLREANPETYAEYGRNRRARKRNAEGKHTAADVRRIFESQRGLCANCKAKLFKSGKNKMHVDHIMPLALGGSNWPSNLQCLCQPCNLSKGARHPNDWARKQGRLL